MRVCVCEERISSSSMLGSFVVMIFMKKFRVIVGINVVVLVVVVLI